MSTWQHRRLLKWRLVGVSSFAVAAAVAACVHRARPSTSEIIRRCLRPTAAAACTPFERRLRHRQLVATLCRSCACECMQARQHTCPARIQSIMGREGVGHICCWQSNARALDVLQNRRSLHPCQRRKNPNCSHFRSITRGKHAHDEEQPMRNVREKRRVYRENGFQCDAARVQENTIAQLDVNLPLTLSSCTARPSRPICFNTF